MPEEKKLEERSDAWLIIAEMGKQSNEREKRDDKKFKMAIGVIIVILFLWFATIGGFIWYLSNSEIITEVYDVTQDTTDGGDSNYIGNNGDIINGSSEGISN